MEKELIHVLSHQSDINLKALLTCIGPHITAWQEAGICSRWRFGVGAKWACCTLRASPSIWTAQPARQRTALFEKITPNMRMLKRSLKSWGFLSR